MGGRLRQPACGMPGAVRRVRTPTISPPSGDVPPGAGRQPARPYRRRPPTLPRRRVQHLPGALLAVLRRRCGDRSDRTTRLLRVPPVRHMERGSRAVSVLPGVRRSRRGGAAAESARCFRSAVSPRLPTGSKAWSIGENSQGLPPMLRAMASASATTSARGTGPRCRRGGRSLRLIHEIPKNSPTAMSRTRVRLRPRGGRDHNGSQEYRGENHDGQVPAAEALPRRPGIGQRRTDGPVEPGGDLGASAVHERLRGPAGEDGRVRRRPSARTRGSVGPLRR